MWDYKDSSHLMTEWSVLDGRSCLCSEFLIVKLISLGVASKLSEKIGGCQASTLRLRRPSSLGEFVVSENRVAQIASGI